jgi:hypothetical protein
LLFRAEHAFDGLNFNAQVMKHVSGASMVGVPFEVLANPPPGMLLKRGKEVVTLRSDSDHGVRLHTYLDQYFRVGGLVTKCSVVQSRAWLLGFPVLSRYINTLDWHQASLSSWFRTMGKAIILEASLCRDYFFLIAALLDEFLTTPFCSNEFYFTMTTVCAYKPILLHTHTLLGPKPKIL